MLIVDDHAPMRSALRKLLRLAYPAFDVQVAANGATALALCRARKLRIVLLDLALPDGNAVGLIAPIKALQPACSVIVVSHYAAATYAAGCLAAGASDYISKDAIFRELRPAIDRALAAS